MQSLFIIFQLQEAFAAGLIKPGLNTMFNARWEAENIHNRACPPVFTRYTKTRFFRPFLGYMKTGFKLYKNQISELIFYVQNNFY